MQPGWRWSLLGAGIVVAVCLGAGCVLDAHGIPGSGGEGAAPGAGGQAGGTPGSGGDGGTAGAGGAGGMAGAGGAGGMAGAGGAGGAGGGAVCGDGETAPSEECDDANDVNGDGCEACVVVCTGPDDLLDPGTHHCYRRLTPPGGDTWWDSRYQCLAQGFDLATISSAEELAFVDPIVGNQATWIGGYELPTPADWRWANREAWGFTDWGGGEPDNVGDGRQCLTLSNGEFRDMSCSDTSRALCERPPPGPCGDGLVNGKEQCDDKNAAAGDGCDACQVECAGTLDPSSHHCYWLVESPEVSWMDAGSLCDGLGVHLATITSGYELDFVVGNFTIPTVFGAWIAGSDGAPEGEFTWLEGEPWSFTAWQQGEPSNGGGNGDENCVELTTTESLWNDDDCSKTQAYFCERSPAGVPLSP